MLDALSKIIGKDRVAQVVNETATPGIIKVVKNVENKPGYKAWIGSEEYKKLDVGSVPLIKEHHPELVNQDERPFFLSHTQYHGTSKSLA